LNFRYDPKNEIFLYNLYVQAKQYEGGFRELYNKMLLKTIFDRNRFARLTIETQEVDQFYEYGDEDATNHQLDQQVNSLWNPNHFGNQNNEDDESSKFFKDLLNTFDHINFYNLLIHNEDKSYRTKQDD